MAINIVHRSISRKTLENYQKIIINDIGIPGKAGFGVGVCPAGHLPDGFIPMAGCTDALHDHYGNYQFQDGSVMVYVPKFFYKIGTGSNGLGVNIVDIKPESAYSNAAAANLDGYALHRTFVDGGEEKQGFFVDKYRCSKNALGTGYVASSIKNGLPISTHADHNPIADLTACVSNAYYRALDAVHARDGEDGVVNSSSIFFAKSQFIQAALALLSMAHGQAAQNNAFCGWQHSTNNFPKGCNNNALGDINDSDIEYESDGYSNCGKTGSGTPFDRTTHNGQSCGVADLNGLMYEISIGITCVASSKSITAASQAGPCVIECGSHGLSTGNVIMIASVGGMTEVNDKIFTVTVVDVDNVSLNGVDSTGFTAYTSGGSITAGTFYVAKTDTAMKDFTSGSTGIADHWGASGVAAMMDEIDIPFLTTYPDNGFSRRMGNSANQVLSEAVSGNGYILSGLGLPAAATGISSSGSNLFGADYFYQYVKNGLCLRSCAYWSSSSNAGVWAAAWKHARSYSSTYVGFRAACYPG